MMIRKSTMILLIGFITVVAATSAADAQVPRVRIQQNTYDVTIVSDFGIPVRVGIFGYSERATFRLTFDGGRTGPDVYTQELIGGARVVIVWNTQGRRLLVADLTVDGSGTLVLGPQFARAAGAAALGAGAAPRAAEGGGAPLEGDIPRLKIKPKN